MARPLQLFHCMMSPCSTLAFLVCAAVVTSTTTTALAGEREFGIMVDAGVPDGAHVSIVYRPHSWLRLHGGGGYNGISKGARAGATWMPLQTIIRPVLVCEAGRYFEGDANPLLRRITGDPEAMSAALSQVGYDYANARAGVEIGSARVTFYLHAGFSAVRGQLRGLNTVLNDESTDPTIRFKSDPNARALIPSARIGLITYFM